MLGTSRIVFITTLSLFATLVLAGCSLRPTPKIEKVDQAPTSTQQEGTPANTNTAPKQSATTPKERGITSAEVSQHDSATDCWMTIEGTVYNVTPYVTQHPDYQETIVSGCGKDATAMFQLRPQTGTPHPPKAERILAEFKIGVLSE